MADFGFDSEEIAQLIRLVESRNLAGLELAEGGRRIEIRGRRPRRNREAGPAFDRGERVEADVRSGLVAIASPMVGVFYRAAAPDSPPLVEAGDHVEVGQPIGLIEAMKVFSEIPSDVSGTVVEIAAQNGELVRQGEPLMYLRPA